MRLYIGPNRVKGRSHRTRFSIPMCNFSIIFHGKCTTRMFMTIALASHIFYSASHMSALILRRLVKLKVFQLLHTMPLINSVDYVTFYGK